MFSSHLVWFIRKKEWNKIEGKQSIYHEGTTTRGVTASPDIPNVYKPREFEGGTLNSRRGSFHGQNTMRCFHVSDDIFRPAAFSHPPSSLLSAWQHFHSFNPVQISDIPDSVVFCDFTSFSPWQPIGSFNPRKTSNRHNFVSACICSECLICH